MPFPLLPDDKGELAAKYKVPVVGGVARRITYLIGKDGKVFVVAMENESSTSVYGSSDAPYLNGPHREVRARHGVQ